MTRLSCAPTGDFLIALMCCSLSVSFENLMGADTFEGAEELLVGAALCDLEVFEDGRDDIAVRVDWHLSCCCLNLLRLSCSDICKMANIMSLKRITQYKNTNTHFMNKFIIISVSIRTIVEFSEETIHSDHIKLS